MDRMLREELEIPLEPSVFWTDSTSVLKYIRNETSRFNTFVANRMTTIRATSDSHQWRYVNGDLNPADWASRGISVPNFLKSAIWISGPEYLQRPGSEWPQTPDSDLYLTAEDPEVKVLAVNVVDSKSSNPINKLFSRYSDWHCLKRAVAWIIRIKAGLKGASATKKNLLVHKQDENIKQALHMQDLQDAEDAIIRFCQKTSFTDEMCSLQMGKAIKTSSLNSHLSYKMA